MKTIELNTTKEINVYTFGELPKQTQTEIKQNFISEFVRYCVYDEFVSDIIEDIIKNENIQLEFSPLEYYYNGEPSEMTIKNNKKLPLLIRFVLPNIDIDGENVQSKLFDHDGFKLENYNLLTTQEKQKVVKQYNQLQQKFIHFSKSIFDMFDMYLNDTSLSLDTRALHKHCNQYYYTLNGEDIGLIEEFDN